MRVLIVGALCLMQAAHAATVEVQPIPLDGENTSNNVLDLYDRREFSGMDWWGDRLALISETDLAIYFLSKSDVKRCLESGTEDSDGLELESVEMDYDAIPLRKMDIDGPEAIVFDGDRVWIVFEAGGRSNMKSYLIEGVMEGNPPAMRALRHLEVPLFHSFDNFSIEAMVKVGSRLILFPELNGANRAGEAPRARTVDLDAWTIGELPMATMEYRLTDATQAEDGRVWVINYLYSGEWSEVDPAPDEIDPGLTADLSEGDALERLVELRIGKDEVDVTGTDRVYTYLGEGGTERNWEGIVRLDDRGFVLLKDKHPPRAPTLAFVPAPAD